MKLAIITKKSIGISLLIASCIGMSACKSTKLVLDEDMTAPEIIQQGQNFYQSYKYKKALYCYQTVIERYGSNPAYYVEARYEIAHLYIKQKKYDLAKPMLEEITDIYASSVPGSLPGAYHKLAQLDLEKIPVKGKKRVVEQKTDQSALQADVETPDEY